MNRKTQKIEKNSPLRLTITTEIDSIRQKLNEVNQIKKTEL